MTKKKMIEYLTGIGSYPTSNSWNNANGYSFNVKIHFLPFTNEERQKLYEIIGDENLSEEFYNELNWTIEEYEDKINEFYNEKRSDPLNHIPEEEKTEWAMKRQFQIGFNGRSGGHLVLYKWNGYNYGGTGWYFSKKELEEMYKEEVERIYKVVKLFEECKNAIVEESKRLANLPIKQKSYQKTVVYKTLFA